MVIVAQYGSGAVDFPKVSIVVSGTCIVPVISKRSVIIGNLSNTTAFGMYESYERACEVIKEVCKAYASGQKMFVLPEK